VTLKNPVGFRSARAGEILLSVVHRCCRRSSCRGGRVAERGWGLGWGFGLGGGRRGGVAANEKGNERHVRII
jgi:hypothetical protein